MLNSFTPYSDFPCSNFYKPVDDVDLDKDAIEQLLCEVDYAPSPGAEIFGRTFTFTQYGTFTISGFVKLSPSAAAARKYLITADIASQNATLNGKTIYSRSGSFTTPLNLPVSMTVVISPGDSVFIRITNQSDNDGDVFTILSAFSTIIISK